MLVARASSRLAASSALRSALEGTFARASACNENEQGLVSGGLRLGYSRMTVRREPGTCLPLKPALLLRKCLLLLWFLDDHGHVVIFVFFRGHSRAGLQCGLKKKKPPQKKMGQSALI